MAILGKPYLLALGEGVADFDPEVLGDCLPACQLVLAVVRIEVFDHIVRTRCLLAGLGLLSGVGGVGVIGLERRDPGGECRHLLGVGFSRPLLAGHLACTLVVAQLD